MLSAPDKSKRQTAIIPAGTPLSLTQRLGRALMQNSRTVLFRKGRDVVEYALDYFFAECTDKRVETVPEYAVFSAMTYGSIGEGAATVRGQDLLVPDGWELRRDFPSAAELALESGNGLTGLRYDVWYSMRHNRVVISFRGTRSSVGDWVSNLRWITRFVPRIDDHYDIVRQGIGQLMTHAVETFGADVDCVTTGHSLGGGLAQHAAYSHPRITSVYAFNSSPVTGYWSVDKSERIINRENTYIARIFEHGEFLAYIRFMLRKLYRTSTADPEIVEVRFNFEKNSNVFSEHSMSRLARNIWAVARDEPFSELS